MKLLCKRGVPFEYTDPASKRPYFSNSQILAVLYGDRFAGADEAVLEVARQRGTDLHKCFFYTLASLRLPNVKRPERPHEFGGYFDALCRFVEEYQPMPILLEESDVDEKLGVAGTPDAKLKIAGKIVGVELKTAVPHRAHKTQVNIYRNFKEYADCDEWHLLYLNDDGTFDFPIVYYSPFHRAWVENGVNVLRGRMMDDE